MKLVCSPVYGRIVTYTLCDCTCEGIKQPVEYLWCRVLQSPVWWRIWLKPGKEGKALVALIHKIHFIRPLSFLSHILSLLFSFYPTPLCPFFLLHLHPITPLASAPLDTLHPHFLSVPHTCPFLSLKALIQGAIFSWKTPSIPHFSPHPSLLFTVCSPLVHTKWKDELPNFSCAAEVGVDEGGLGGGGRRRVEARGHCRSHQAFIFMIALPPRWMSALQAMSGLMEKKHSHLPPPDTIN